MHSFLTHQAPKIARSILRRPKIIWHDGQGACLFTKRLERGRFLWPSMTDGVVTISAAQLSYLLSGIDWRMPQETWRPQAAG
jgi:transposase